MQTKQVMQHALLTRLLQLFVFCKTWRLHNTFEGLFDALDEIVMALWSNLPFLNIQNLLDSTHKALLNLTNYLFYCTAPHKVWEQMYIKCICD